MIHQLSRQLASGALSRSALKLVQRQTPSWRKRDSGSSLLADPRAAASSGSSSHSGTGGSNPASSSGELYRVSRRRFRATTIAYVEVGFSAVVGVTGTAVAAGAGRERNQKINLGEKFDEIAGANVSGFHEVLMRVARIVVVGRPTRLRNCFPRRPSPADGYLLRTSSIGLRGLPPAPSAPQAPISQPAPSASVCSTARPFCLSVLFIGVLAVAWVSRRHVENLVLGQHRDTDCRHQTCSRMIEGSAMPRLNPADDAADRDGDMLGSRHGLDLGLCFSTLLTGSMLTP